DSFGQVPCPLRCRPDRDAPRAAARQAHPPAGAGRCRSLSLQPAGRVGEDHDHGEVGYLASSGSTTRRWWSDICISPWKGWLRSTIRNSALDTDSAKTNTVDSTIVLVSANRQKLPKITVSQNSSTMKNGIGIALSLWVKTRSRVRASSAVFWM